MKKALLVLLVAIVILTGLPVLMGMPGMAACSECGPALAPVCLAVILAAGLVIAGLLGGQRVRRTDNVVPRLLHAFLLERPPRFA